MKDSKYPTNKEYLEKLSQEIDWEFDKLLASEVDELKRISEFTESVRTKIELYYKDMFPKKCKSCNKIFNTREEYLQETERLRKTSTIFDDVGLQEYRNCHCGSTMMLWAGDRRDLTELGKLRRELYQRCLEKIGSLGPTLDIDHKRLREIFALFSS